MNISHIVIAVAFSLLVCAVRADEGKGVDDRQSVDLRVKVAITLICRPPKDDIPLLNPPKQKPPITWPSVRPHSPPARGVAPLMKQAPKVGLLARAGTWLGRGGRIVSRFVPGLGLALLAYDVYENRTIVLDSAKNIIGYFNGFEPPLDGKIEKYEEKCHVMGRATEGGDYEIIIPESLGDGVVALRFHTGYLTVDPCTGKLTAQAFEVGDWEKFRVVRNPDKTIAFLSCSNGKYLSAANGGGGCLQAAAEKVGMWESFYPSEIEGKGLYLFTRDAQKKWWCVTVDP